MPRSLPSARFATLLLLATLLFASTGCASLFGRQPARAPEPAAAAEDDEDDYEDAIPEDAVSRTGLFTTHLAPDGQILFEIPEAELGKEMLLLVGIAERPGQDGSAGGGDIVQWDRRGDQVTLRLKDYSQIADSSEAIWSAVSGMMKGPVVAAFDIEATSPSGALVIDVTELFTTTHEELGSLPGVEDELSWVEKVAAFPRNIEVDVTQTGEGADDANTSVKLHWSFLRLPDVPMMPRYADDRVGFISRAYVDYSSRLHGSDERRIIRRHKLVKANPNAALSDPVEPIVYWVDPATPDWLKPYVVQGVNDWQPAFEKAGFTNAIFGRVGPTPEQDADFSMDDARYSVIYWRPSTTANANGGAIMDPRSGEIIRGRVQMFHNVMDLVQDWYFTQVGPLDARARRLPLPDSLMGRLVRYVVAHEIGHAIGFPHNFKASAMYPVDSLRSAAFLRRMGGHVATLMDYSRFNYVAQPEDNVPVELLVPGIGPYDHYAVMWGYTPIAGARTPEDELPTLDRWARMQDTIPWFRFTTAGMNNDPNALTEAVGDEDAVKASTLGLLNLRRVKDMLIPAAEKPGESYELLGNLYGNLVSQWRRYHGHVAAVVGGAYSQEKYGTGARFEPVGRERQREAVHFLNQNVFHVPDWLLDQDILRRIEAEGAVERIRAAQVGVLGTLITDAKLNRLIEYESLSSDAQDAVGPYSLTDMMQDLRAGVWTELQATSGPVRIDVYRRNLQRGYLDLVDQRLNPRPPPEGEEPTPPVLSDVRPVLRGELRWLQGRLASASARAADEITRLHIADLQDEVKRLLENGGM